MPLRNVVESVPGAQLPTEVAAQLQEQQQESVAGEPVLDTPDGLPPYLNHTTLKSSGTLFLVGSLVGLLWFISAKQDYIQVRI